MPRIRTRCSIYIKFGKRAIKFPVTPEEIEVDYPTDHKTHHVIGLGEVAVPIEPSLRVVAWKSLFPGDTSAPYTNEGTKEPNYYIALIEKAMKNRQICRLIISRSGSYDTNMRCIVSSFKTTDKGGEPEDIYYSLELKEYRNYAPTTVSFASASDSELQAVSEETQRQVETPVLRVGAEVIVTGKYWYDSYGSKPFGTANSLRTTVTRIVSGNQYPIHVGRYGWVQENQLQIVG